MFFTDLGYQTIEFITPLKWFYGDLRQQFSVGPELPQVRFLFHARHFFSRVFNHSTKTPEKSAKRSVDKRSRWQNLSIFCAFWNSQIVVFSPYSLRICLFSCLFPYFASWASWGRKCLHVALWNTVNSLCQSRCRYKIGFQVDLWALQSKLMCRILLVFVKR